MPVNGPPAWSETTAFALRIAGEAGDFLLERFRRDPALLSRRGTAKEITTQYDKESDALIVSAVRGAFPAHGILAEESGAVEGQEDILWLIDSLDGSSNFAVGNPFFAVSIGIMKSGSLQAGVIHAPFLGETYVAEAGKGAWLNGERIHASDIAALEGSYLVCCEGGDATKLGVVALNASLHPVVKDLRKLGSAAIEGAWVAAGRVEGYYSPNLDPWDAAAAVIIAREAGGQASNFQNEPWQPRRDSCLITNGKVHERILAAIRNLQNT